MKPTKQATIKRQPADKFSGYKKGSEIMDEPTKKNQEEKQSVTLSKKKK